jgi:hypothetical protein
MEKSLFDASTSSINTACSEIVVFEVVAGNLGIFVGLREKLIAETRASFPGFIGAQLHQDSENPSLLIDIWHWQDLKSARAGFAGFSALPSAARLMQMVKKRILSGHFSQITPLSSSSASS